MTEDHFTFRYYCELCLGTHLLNEKCPKEETKARIKNIDKNTQAILKTLREKGVKE